MKTLLAVALLFLATPLLAAGDPRIAEGIALHDAGKYDEAIARYKAVLADSPGDVLATYEMSFSYQAKGDFAACRAALEPLADKRDRLQPLILSTLGNCLDLAGESGRAIAVYRKGLKIAPGEPQLLYNLAIALMGQQKYSEARELLKKELALRPGHGSGHYALGQVFQAENFRTPAILSYLRLLAIESGTPRTADAAQRLVALLNLGVDKKSEGEINVTIDPSSRTEEGDFKAAEMMLALASASRFTEDRKDASPFESVRSQVALAVRMLIEAPPKGKNYTVRENIPFFARLEEKKFLDVMAGIAILSLNLEGADAWKKENDAGIREYAVFVRGLPR